MTEEYFTQNNERFSLLAPERAKQLALVECTRVFLTTTESGKESLSVSLGEERYPLHEEDPEKEAEEWFTSLDLYHIPVLYVYGVGLGYYFEAALEWLKDPSHYLVFLEIDPEVLHRLFETERGCRLLRHRQVRIYWFDWGTLENIWLQMAQLFYRYAFKVSGLKAYSQIDGAEAVLTNIRSRLEFWYHLQGATLAEYASCGEHFFFNFYQNLTTLPQSYLAGGLQGKFTGIPAIVCGAGPSLDKNLAVLEGLKDKAIIFAGGTAMNAVNSGGFLPNFGVGIDPNEPQSTRLIMNTAYEVPFIYRGRLYHPALSLVHGNKLYVTGSGTYRLPSWFEEKLAIPAADLDEGFNVVNFSISLAAALGCTPIILVGLDLAYSDLKSYQSGVHNHPIHHRGHDFKTKNPNEELRIQSDIYGQPVYTLWKWVGESIWISQRAEISPEVQFINATEGGIGMRGIPNIPLKDVAEKYLTRAYPLSLQIFAEIQNAPMPAEVTLEKVLGAVQEMQQSFTHCAIQLAKTIGAKLQPAEVASQLDPEPAYHFLLKEFSEQFLSSRALEKQQLIYDPDLTQEQRKEMLEKLENELYRFLGGVAAWHTIMLESLAGQIVGHQIMGQNSASTIQTIPQPEVKSAKTALSPAEAVFERCYYPSGALKWEYSHLNGCLEGEATYFTETGSLLAKGCYVKGVQEGSSVLYYRSGEIYSMQNFKKGLFDALQTYLYPSGQIKSLLPYKEGKLDGKVVLNYPTGKPKREIHFLLGKREGVERMWDKEGRLSLEVEYKKDLPIGKSRAWHSNGQLSTENVYDEEGKLLSEQHWQADGRLIVRAKSKRSGYFNWLVQETQTLTNALENVYKQLNSLNLFLNVSEQDSKRKEELIAIQQTLQELQQTGKEIMKQVEERGDAVDEPLWHTPSNQRIVEQKMSELTENLRGDLKQVQEIVAKIQHQKR